MDDTTTIGFLFVHFDYSSVNFKENAVYWIGATDVIFEGDYRWTNGFPYTFSNWFPGWSEHNNYNKQPNDDGK